MLKLWFLSKKGLWLRRGFAVLMLAAITWISLMDTASLVDSSGDHLFRFIANHIGCHEDKCVHFTLYFLLTLVLWHALPLRVSLPFVPRRLPSALLAGLGATFWGVLMELAQRATYLLHWGHRQFEWADILANTLGALVMTMFLLGLTRVLCHTFTRP